MKKLVKVLMMMALVLGVASCNDQDDAPVMPNNPSDNQEEVEEPTGGQTEYFDIVQRLKDSASGYDNVTIIDKTTEKMAEVIGNGMLYFDCSSFDNYSTVITVDDYGISYDVYLPSTASKLNLKAMDKNPYLRIDWMYIYLEEAYKQLDFHKELLGLREGYEKNQEHEFSHYYRYSNDYVIATYNSDEPQTLLLEFASNKIDKEAIMTIVVSDGLPDSKAALIIHQAAK